MQRKSRVNSLERDCGTREERKKKEKRKKEMERERERENKKRKKEKDKESETGCTPVGKSDKYLTGIREEHTWIFEGS